MGSRATPETRTAKAVKQISVCRPGCRPLIVGGWPPRKRWKQSLAWAVPGSARRMQASRIRKRGITLFRPAGASCRPYDTVIGSMIVGSSSPAPARFRRGQDRDYVSTIILLLGETPPQSIDVLGAALARLERHEAAELAQGWDARLPQDVRLCEPVRGRNARMREICRAMTLDELGTRICIMGPSNSGKSTLAEATGQAKALNVVRLDQLHHLPKTDWVHDRRKSSPLFTMQQLLKTVGQSKAPTLHRFSMDGKSYWIHPPRWVTTISLYRYVRRPAVPVSILPQPPMRSQHPLTTTNFPGMRTHLSQPIMRPR